MMKIIIHIYFNFQNYCLFRYFFYILKDFIGFRMYNKSNKQNTQIMNRKMSWYRIYFYIIKLIFC